MPFIRKQDFIMINFVPALAALSLLAGCAAFSSEPNAVGGAHSDVRIVLASQVEWQALNPARGAASPRAATLWGDRSGEPATGFLARFPTHQS